MYLIINPWSATIKYSVINKWEILYLWVIQISDDAFNKGPIEYIYKDLLSKGYSDIYAIWFRVVHWWPKYSKPCLIDPIFLKNLHNMINLAPYHNRKAYECIAESLEIYWSVRKFAVFDTSFHSSIPQLNNTYAIPAELSAKFGIRKYWFHWISCEYLVNKVKVKYPYLAKWRIIICHLWSWCSITAVKWWKSFNTSMWLTPVSWMISDKRSWTIDPSIPILLARQGYSIDEIELILNSKSWLLWLSGQRSMKAIIEQGISPFTIDFFVNQIIGFIWEYYFEMQGVDAICFSWWIGEASSIIREKVCRRLYFNWVRLSSAKNHSNTEWIISTKSSQIAILMLKTNEELAIAKAIGNL